MAAGQTIVEYGDVEIFSCHTQRFVQEVVQDESATDLMYVRTTVEVSGILHGRSISALDTSLGRGVGDAATSAERNATSLLPPRQRFRMRFGADADGDGGTAIIDISPVSSIYDDNPVVGYDVNGGPKCTRFELSHFANNTAFRVTAAFEICSVPCANFDQQSKGVLSNRWSVLDEVDQNFRTTRTYQGRLVTTGQIYPHELRNYVVPSLQPGLRRERMSFVVDKSGRAMDYTIVDVEAMYSPPSPATNWSLSMTVETADDKNIGASCSVMVEGDRNATPRQLIALAIRVLDAKLIGIPFAVPEQRQKRLKVEHYSITEEQSPSANRVLAFGRISSTVSVTDLTEDGIQQRLMAINSFGKPLDKTTYPNLFPNYDSNRSRGSREGDEIETQGPISPVGIFSVYLQTPCNDEHQIGTSDFTAESESDQPDSRAEVEVRQVESLSDQPVEYLSPAYELGAYEYWQLDSKYVTNRMVAQLPVAASNLSSDENTSVVVSLGRATSKRIVRARGERISAPPEMPSGLAEVDANGIAYVPLRQIVQTQTPPRTLSLQKLYVVDVEYHQAMSRPLVTQGDQIAIGRNPYDNDGDQSIAADTVIRQA